jgi:hypothetical protein
MKNISFYPTIWQPVPYSVYSAEQVKLEELKTKKNLILNNEILLEKEISEMTLSVVKLSAIDKDGTTHLISSFDKQILNLKGQSTRLNIQTKEELKLAAGQYSAFRLHIDKHGVNSFVCSDRTKGTIKDLEYLDFNIEDGFNVQEGESYELRLNFNFTPYTFSSYFNPLRDILKKQILFSKKLTRSFGS